MSRYVGHRRRAAVQRLVDMAGRRLPVSAALVISALLAGCSGNGPLMGSMTSSRGATIAFDIDRRAARGPIPEARPFPRRRGGNSPDSRSFRAKARPSFGRGAMRRPNSAASEPSLRGSGTSMMRTSSARSGFQAKKRQPADSEAGPRPTTRPCAGSPAKA